MTFSTRSRAKPAWVEQVFAVKKGGGSGGGGGGADYAQSILGRGHTLRTRRVACSPATRYRCCWRTATPCTVGATQLNVESSRSHAIFTLKLTQRSSAMPDGVTAEQRQPRAPSTSRARSAQSARAATGCRRRAPSTRASRPSAPSSPPSPPGGSSTCPTVRAR